MNPIKILIIEDEPPAVKRLTEMLEKLDVPIDIVDCIDNVEHAVRYLRNFDKLDLIISDIQLADGNSFEIFSQVDVKVPVIFSTAYDEFMLQAFKVNSVDYLLKPFDDDDLNAAIAKFTEIHLGKETVSDFSMKELLSTLEKKKYKERFLVKKGKELAIIPTNEVAYFYSEDGYVHLINNQGSKYIVEFTLDNLAGLLDPSSFFRISRKFYIHADSIFKINPYFNSRLKLELKPNCKLETIVSRERVSEFKSWLDT